MSDAMSDAYKGFDLAAVMFALMILSYLVIMIVIMATNADKV